MTRTGENVEQQERADECWCRRDWYRHFENTSASSGKAVRPTPLTQSRCSQVQGDWAQPQWACTGLVLPVLSVTTRRRLRFCREQSHKLQTWKHPGKHPTVSLINCVTHLCILFLRNLGCILHKLLFIWQWFLYISFYRENEKVIFLLARFIGHFLFLIFGM